MKKNEKKALLDVIDVVIEREEGESLRQYYVDSTVSGMYAIRGIVAAWVEDEEKEVEEWQER